MPPSILAQPPQVPSQRCGPRASASDASQPRARAPQQEKRCNGSPSPAPRERPAHSPGGPAPATETQRGSQSSREPRNCSHGHTAHQSKGQTSDKDTGFKHNTARKQGSKRRFQYSYVLDKTLLIPWTMGFNVSGITSFFFFVLTPSKRRTHHGRVLQPCT